MTYVRISASLTISTCILCYKCLLQDLNACFYCYQNMNSFFAVLTGSTSPEMSATWAASLAFASVAMAVDGQLSYTNLFKRDHGLCSWH